MPRALFFTTNKDRTTMTDIDDRGRYLAEFANASGQPNQPARGHALVRPTTGLSERVIGAQPVEVYRDEARVLSKLAALAAAAGSDWFYRFPVKNRAAGTTDWIEGPSIKLANDVARIYGNNVIEVRELDVGDAWVFYSRFTDIETGFSMERAYRQRKSQGGMKTKDADRQLDIAYQIGQSKAIRNVICNALQTYADYAFEAARNSLVEKIGRDLPGWRERTLQGIAKMRVDVVRVERVVGRPARDWLAPNLAQIIAMMKSVADGMASVDEVFPPLEASAPAAPNNSAGKQEGGGAQRQSEPASDETGDPVSASAGTSAPGAAATDPLAIAHKRGQEAKAAGQARKAIPVELRDPDRVRETDAWLAGWDGKAVPDKGLV
jgi:ribosome modulation factor